MTGNLWRFVPFSIAAGLVLAGCMGMGEAGPGGIRDPASQGPWLAFTVMQGEKRDIYIVNRDGSRLENLTQGRGKNIWPSWSPDGRQVAFATNRDGNWEIYGVDLTDFRQTRMTRTPEREGAPAWSPINGNRLAFLVGGEEQKQIDVVSFRSKAGPQRTRLTDLPGDKVAVAWSPDGKTLAFESNAVGHWEIYRVDSEGGPPVRLTEPPADSETPVWSPDGRRLAFETNRDGNWDLYTMAPDGSGQTRLTNTAGADSNPSWSPDGRHLAFDSVQQGKGEICIMDADGQGLRNLTNHPADDIAPQWSPDGNQIAFSSDRDGHYQIYVMDSSDGTHLRQLTRLPGESKWPFWSPK